MNCHTLLMLLLPTKAPLIRPSFVGSIDSEARPVRCHWEDASHAALCDEVIPAIEEAWAIQVDELGWPAPLSDEDGILDVYVSTDGGGGAYAYGPYEDQDPSDGRMGTYAYIVIDPAFETWIRWTMLHEFNHVLQYGIDMTEPRYIPWEGTATAAESWSDPTLLPLGEYISDFQGTPWVGLLGDGWMLWDDHEIWSYYEYGAALWLFHLDATTGDGAGSAGLDLWLDGAQDSPDNEPDFLDAVGLTTGDWVAGWMDFSIDRTAVGTPSTPAWAATYEDSIYQVHIEASLDVSELPRSIHPAFMPFQTGVIYAEVTGLTPGTPLLITADGDPSVRWAVLAAEGETGSWLEGGTLRWEARSESVVVGVVNLGPAGFDSDDPMESADVQLRVALADSLESDGADKSGGCGCSSVQPRAAGPWLLLMLGVFRRRHLGRAGHHRNGREAQFVAANTRNRSMMRLHKGPTTMKCFWIFLGFLSGCGNDQKLVSGIACGAGTVLIDGICEVASDGDTGSAPPEPEPDTGEPPPSDIDGDGYTVEEGDCDDEDERVNPDAVERCDDIDNNCDGVIDEKDAEDAQMFFRDADLDEYGNDDDVRRGCTAPLGYVPMGGDCDDTDPLVNPGVPEVWYDGIDSDCAGDSDFDADGDGHDSDVYDGDDCDDEDGDRSPSEVEVCDEADLDEDCNEFADDADPDTDPASMSTWYADADGDGLGDAEGVGVVQCEEPLFFDDADIDFEDYPDGTHVTEQYSALGVHFDGTAFALIGGLAEGDPGNWDLEGTAGSHFLGFNGGSYSDILSFDSPLNSFSLDVSRANGSSAGESFTLTSYLDGEVVESIDTVLPGINTWVTVSIEDSWFDELMVQCHGSSFRPYGIDNLIFGMASELAGYVLDHTDCDDSDASIGGDC